MRDDLTAANRKSEKSEKEDFDGSLGCLTDPVKSKTFFLFLIHFLLRISLSCLHLF